MGIDHVCGQDRGLRPDEGPADGDPDVKRVTGTVEHEPPLARGENAHGGIERGEEAVEDRERGVWDGLGHGENARLPGVGSTGRRACHNRAVVPEAPLQKSGGGHVPTGEGWFILNARDARWLEGHFGAYTRFEGDARFPEVGINIGVLGPGQPGCMYHREDAQENFLVLSGECRLLIEGEERMLKAWDFVHCPPWTDHVFVGGDDGPCTILAIGTRLRDEVVYPVSELAQRYGASVSVETAKPAEAYASIPDDAEAVYRDGWLPG